jgi:hypothetical protein
MNVDTVKVRIPITLVGSCHALQLFFVGFLLWDESSDDYRVK